MSIVAGVQNISNTAKVCSTLAKILDKSDRTSSKTFSDDLIALREETKRTSLYISAVYICVRRYILSSGSDVRNRYVDSAKNILIDKIISDFKGLVPQIFDTENPTKDQLNQFYAVFNAIDQLERK